MNNEVLKILICCITLVVLVLIICITFVFYTSHVYKKSQDVDKLTRIELQRVQKQTNEIYTMYRKILEEVREERNE